MNYNDLRNQAKIDSRRFGKGVVCKILHGQILAIAYREGLVPSGVYFNENTGLDPINNKMMVVPVIVYKDLLKLVKNYQTSANPETTSSTDSDALESITLSRDPLVNFIRQNAVLVTVNSHIDQGKKAGLDPEAYNILIDSIDVNQTIEGRYVYNTVQDIRKIRTFDE